MKMTQANINRLPGDRIKITAEFTDRMRRPAEVQVVLKHGEMASAGSSTVIEGDQHEVYTTLESLATIAWRLGWRPPGFGKALVDAIQTLPV